MISINQEKLLIETDSLLFKKIAYIARYDEQTIENTLKQMMTEWIRAFEESEGIIPIY